MEQFLHIFRRVKDRTNDVLKWGDEVGHDPARSAGALPLTVHALSSSCIATCALTVVRVSHPGAVARARPRVQIEYHLVEFRGDVCETRLSLTGPEVLAQLEREDAENK